MSGGRSIKKLVQLVAIDNNYFLFSREILQRGMSLGFNLGEHTKNPLKDIYMTTDGLCQSFARDERKQVIPHIQKINFTFIDKEGTSNFEASKKLKKVYLEFTRLKNKEELKIFIREKNGFCIFPNESEMKILFKEYEKAGITEFPIHYAVYKHPVPKKIKKESDKTIEYSGDKINKVNIDFIWKKQQELKFLVELYSSEDFREHKLLWINKQLENVSEALMSQNNFVWKRVREGGLIKKDDRDLEEVSGMRNIKNLALVSAYRIYGHYALCCLEFCLDIQKKVPLFTCKECGQLNVKNKRSRKHCSKEENEECFKRHNARRKRKSYFKLLKISNE